MTSSKLVLLLASGRGMYHRLTGTSRNSKLSIRTTGMYTLFFAVSILISLCHLVNHFHRRSVNTQSVGSISSDSLPKTASPISIQPSRVLIPTSLTITHSLDTLWIWKGGSWKEAIAKSGMPGRKHQRRNINSLWIAWWEPLGIFHSFISSELCY